MDLGTFKRSGIAVPMPARPAPEPVEEPAPSRNETAEVGA